MNPVARAFEAAKVSIQGGRTNNQDRCLFLSAAETAFLCLGDGLGGHPRGEAASQLLVDASETLFRRSPKPLPDPQRFMLQCVGRAHQAIVRFGLRQTPPIAPRTTAVMCVVQHGMAHWAHVGDSRLYLLRNGAIIALTRDHARVDVPLAQTASSQPRAGLTRCLGGTAKPPITTCSPPIPLLTGDLILLCSDGLWAQVSASEIVGTLNDAEQSLDECLTRLAQRAATMPNSDNVTAVAMRWLDEEKARVGTSTAEFDD